ncbi:amiloride-sensitive sodium channel subunit alpha-like [Paramuricea clavata]|uniref:Amiloride-sensitive sodium channel subunit alpha-like n=1 Tax=Paramuricea clavata TaxID=317549 RepID=A0A7D9HK90_PARCT|nr:amiloride-sensitive sodium channel subunit alpha-like [Paramuricea clavata]
MDALPPFYRSVMTAWFALERKFVDNEYVICGPRKSMVTLEQLSAIQCIHTVSSHFKKHKLGCDEKCPQPCEQQSFLNNIMTATLTSKEKELRKKKSFGDNNETDFVFDDNILRVKIFYHEFNLQKIVQSTYYDIETLIGDIGGQLGLWIGVSIISVAEFGELLINLCIVAARKYHDRRKSKTAVIELQ